MTSRDGALTATATCPRDLRRRRDEPAQAASHGASTGRRE
ncbi:hypothetical protein FM106_17515 [Brachybacterium faecium]|nr:hypothetical protein FM106_17515 [Brachybacterium faecium]